MTKKPHSSGHSNCLKRWCRKKPGAETESRERIGKEHTIHARHQTDDGHVNIATANECKVCSAKDRQHTSRKRAIALSEQDHQVRGNQSVDKITSVHEYDSEVKPRYLKLTNQNTRPEIVSIKITRMATSERSVSWRNVSLGIERIAIGAAQGFLAQKKSSRAHRLKMKISGTTDVLNYQGSNDR